MQYLRSRIFAATPVTSRQPPAAPGSAMLRFVPGASAGEPIGALQLS